MLIPNAGRILPVPSPTTTPSREYLLKLLGHGMHAAVTCVQNWKLSEALGGRISTQTLGILHVVN